jgi:membrane-bound metal-dependent hydrolase YbcI (DUF457 family)
MNSEEHFAIGSIMAFLVNCVQQKQSSPKIDLIKAATWGLLGGSVALLPDVLEPATNPNHRSSFHSIGLGLGLILFNKGFAENKNLSEEEKRFLSAMSLAYGSHLLADLTTPKELPVL